MAKNWLINAFFILIGPIVGSVLGAASGWVVDLFLGLHISSILTMFGVETALMDLWELGATLGFIAGFFRVPTPVTQ